MNLFLGLFFGLIAQILTFIQLQGPLKWKSFSDHRGWLPLAGVPIAWLFMESVRHITLHFGTIWPSRLIGFSIGIMVFAIMSLIMFDEAFTPKTLVCISLGLAILAVQLFWK